VALLGHCGEDSRCCAHRRCRLLLADATRLGRGLVRFADRCQRTAAQGGIRCRSAGRRHSVNAALTDPAYKFGTMVFPQKATFAGDPWSSRKAGQ
jgi:hypothetical protein